VRRGAYERGLEEEAEQQGALAERNRTNELMTLGYEEAMKWLEEVGPRECKHRT
jgi:tRNA A37 N6-isopentenylltransferase MiaA